MTTQTKPTAQDAFTAEVCEIDALIAKLAALRADHFGVSPEAVNWGHVGSAKRTVAELRDILAHYGPLTPNNQNPEPQMTKRSPFKRPGVKIDIRKLGLPVYWSHTLGEFVTIPE